MPRIIHEGTGRIWGRRFYVKMSLCVDGLAKLRWLGWCRWVDLADPPNPTFESTSKDNDKTFQKTNAETILGQSSSGTTLEYNFGIFSFLLYCLLVLPIGPCYSLVEEQAPVILLWKPWNLALALGRRRWGAYALSSSAGPAAALVYEINLLNKVW